MKYRGLRNPRIQYVGAAIVQPGVVTGSSNVALNDISATTTPPAITPLALAETKAAEAESRGARLVSDLLEQKHSLIGALVNFLFFVIMSLYITFMVVLLCLFVSKSAFSSLPATAVVLVGFAGSVPTILSISLLVGLLSSKDSKEKEDKSATIDIASAAKIGAEVAKQLRTHS